VNRNASILFGLVLLLVPAGAMAQTAAIRQTCGPELQQYCGGVQPGDGRIRACVKEHFTAFSEPCKQALLNAVAVVRACKADVQRTCPGVQPGGGRIQTCMKDHFADYSERCKQAIVTAKFGKR
jgi:Cysteine rich repeat